MCSLCLKTPCDSRCPNAPEPKPVVNCKECGVGIFEGERFYDSEKGPICEDCMDDMTVGGHVKMANKAKLLIIADEKGMRAEIEGTPSDVMCLVKAALEKGNATLQKHPCISKEDADDLIDEVIEDYQTETKMGEKAAILRRIAKMAKIL